MSHNDQMFIKESKSIFL